MHRTIVTIRLVFMCFNNIVESEMFKSNRVFSLCLTVILVMATPLSVAASEPGDAAGPPDEYQIETTALPEEVFEPLQPDLTDLAPVAESLDPIFSTDAPDEGGDALVPYIDISPLADEQTGTIYSASRLYQLSRQAWDYQNSRLSAMGYATTTVWSDSLYFGALQRAKEVSTPGNFGHDRPNGSSFRTAYTELGIRSSQMGENCAGGGGPQTLIDTLINSPGHFDNMRRNWQYGACAVYPSENGVLFMVQGYLTFDSSSPAMPNPPYKPGGGNNPPLANKDIELFGLGARATISGTTINVTVPARNDLTSMSPVIVHSGVSISPTGARDFSKPVVYTVTAEDGSTKTYTVYASATPVEPSPIPTEGLYVISPKCAYHMVFDISGGSSARGANVQIYSDNNSPAQTFQLTAVGGGYYTLTNVGSGKLLDVSGAGQAPGTNVHQWDANNTNAQKWKITATEDGDYSYYLQSACNGLYLDISGAGNRAGTNVQVYTGNRTNAQKFYFKRVVSGLSPGDYVVSSVLGNSSRNLVLDISGGSRQNGANAQIWSANGTGAQKFRFIYNDRTGYFTIINIQSGLALDVAGGSSASGANVWQYAPNGSRAQWWRVFDVGGGTYCIVSATGNGCCLDVSGAGTANGTNVQVWTQNNTMAQRWRMTAL